MTVIGCAAIGEVSVTVAPGMTAPLESVTTPVISAPAATAVIPNNANRQIADSNKSLIRNMFKFFLSD